MDSSVSHYGVSPQSPHVLLLPFPVLGHTNPFLSIAHYLAASGISITLVQAIDPLLLQASASTAGTSPFRNEVIPSSFDSSPPFSMAKFLASLDGIRNALRQLLQKLMLEENAPTCLLIDSIFGWGDSVAVEFGLHRVDLWTTSASLFCLGYHVLDLVARGFIPASKEGAKEKIVDFIPGLSPIRIADMPKFLTADEGLQSAEFIFFTSLMQNATYADRILANTIYELETSAVEALRKDDHVHIDTVGPLYLTSMASSSSHASLLQEDNSCLSWLNQQQKSSVLYIAFGSIASIEATVFPELAHGLEASGESFLWVIRPDAYKNKLSVEELLPEGFMARTHDQGLVISWAPQLAVLGHTAVGAFLTHCGWNSILESLSNGVPMLGFPQLSEQMTNLKFIVHDWKVGLPLLHEPVDTHKVERVSVQSAVTAIMRGDEGTQARTCAREWKRIAERATHGSSKDNLQKLVDDLKHGRLKRPKEEQHLNHIPK